MPPPPPLLRVLSDAALLRHVASFQRGMPLALFAFWCASDATIAAAAREDRNLIHARHGELLSWILAHGGDDVAQLLDMFESIRYTDYDHKGFHWSSPSVELDRVVHEAVARRRVDLLDWAIAHDALGDTADASHIWSSALDDFASNSDDDDTRVLTRLFEAVPLNQGVVTALALKFQRVELLRWLSAVFPGAKLPRTMTTLAVRRDDLASVRWLCEHRASDGCSPDAFTDALRREKLSILEYLLAHRSDALDWRNARILLEESCGESRALVKRFARTLPLMPAEFVRHAVAFHDYAILSALADVGLLTEVSIDDDAEIGDLGIIQSLHRDGLATATRNTVDRAAANGHWHVALFLLEHRTEGCSMATLVAAVDTGLLELVQFVCDHMPTQATSIADVTEPMDRAAAAGRLAIVRFLHDRGFGCTTNAVDRAVAEFHNQTAMFLFTHRGEGCTVAAARGALHTGRIELARAIYRKQPQLFNADLLAELTRHGAVDEATEVERPDASPDDAREAGTASALQSQHVLEQLKARCALASRTVWI